MKKLILTLLTLLPVTVQAENISVELIVPEYVGRDTKETIAMTKFALSKLGSSINKIIVVKMLTVTPPAFQSSTSSTSRSDEFLFWSLYIEENPTKADYHIVIAPPIKSTDGTEIMAGKSYGVCKWNSDEYSAGLSVANVTIDTTESGKKRWSTGAAIIQHELMHLLGAWHHLEHYNLMQSLVFPKFSKPGEVPVLSISKREIKRCLGSRK